MLLCNALITALQEAPTNGAEMCGRNGHTLPIAKCVNTDLGRLSLDDDVAQPCATINSREVSASDIAAAFAITTGSTECTDELLSLVRIVGANASMHGGIWDSWTLLHAAAYKVSVLYASSTESGFAPVVTVVASRSRLIRPLFHILFARCLTFFSHVATCAGPSWACKPAS